MIALALLPLVAAVVLAAALWRASSIGDRPPDVRLAWVGGCVLSLAIFVVMAEALSVARALHQAAVVAGWALLAAGSIGLWARGHAPVAAFLRATVAAAAQHRLAAGILAAVFGVMAVCALLSPPNNYDSMTYHVARVHYWLQQQSLEFFATPNPRQLEFAPLNALVFAHLHLLTGGDRLDNLVQWAIAAGVLLPGASWLMERFGAGVRVRSLGLTAIATTPAVILEGESTQNDLLLAGLLVATAVWALVLSGAARARRGRWIAALLGISAGLAVLTKGTALIFGAGLAIWWMAIARPWRSWSLVRLGALAGVLVAALNLPHASRNLELSGRLFGSFADGNRLPAVSARRTASNVIKNISLQFAIARPPVNRWLERQFAGAHERLLDFSIYETDTHFVRAPFSVSRSWRREEYVGNWLGIAAIGATLALLPIRSLRGRRRLGGAADFDDARRHLFWWGAGLATAWLLYSALLRWQPWGSRLMTPLFCLAWIWAAPCWRWLEPRRSLVAVAMTFMFLAGIPWLLKNETRPLLGPQSVLRTPREKQWFNGIGPEAQAAFEELETQLARLDLTELGWYSESDDDAEYPVLAALRAHPRRPAVRHIGVAGPSAALERQPPPDLVLGPPRAALTIHGRCYAPLWTNSAYGLYLRDQDGP